MAGKREAQQVQRKPEEKNIAYWYSSCENPGADAWYRTDFPIRHRAEKVDVTASIQGENAYVTVSDTPGGAVLGIGTSLEETSLYNLRRMPEEAQRAILREWVDPNKMGLSVFRLTIGTADFTARDFYTYYDTPPTGEPDWENRSGQGFSIEKDEQYGILACVKRLQEEAEKAGVTPFFFASPWSPPGWMKKPTRKSTHYKHNDAKLKGGRLDSRYLPDYARYLTRYLEEYEKRGISVSALTLQNEALFETCYPSCLVSPEQEAELGRLLRQEIRNSPILQKPVALWLYDHNFAQAAAYIERAGKAGAMAWCDGFALHDYEGEPEQMLPLMARYPGKRWYMTERALWGAAGAARILRYMAAGAGTYVNWVNLLDTNGQTHQWPGKPGPTFMLQNAEEPSVIRRLPEYYWLSLLGRSIRPGDRLLSCESKEVEAAAFLSSDGKKKKVLLVNTGTQEKVVAVRMADRLVQILLPAQHVGALWVAE